MESSGYSSAAVAGLAAHWVLLWLSLGLLPALGLLATRWAEPGNDSEVELRRREFWVRVHWAIQAVQALVASAGTALAIKCLHSAAPLSMHAVLGLASLALLLLYWVLGAFVLGPFTELPSLVWVRAHQAVGLTAYLVATAAIITGVLAIPQQLLHSQAVVYIACIVQGIWTLVVLVAFLLPRNLPLEMSSLELDPTVFEPKGSADLSLELPSAEPPSLNTEGLRPVADADGLRLPQKESPVSVSCHWGASAMGNSARSCPV